MVFFYGVLLELNELFALFIVLGSLAFIWKDVKTVLLIKLKSERYFQHITFGVMFALFLLWSADAGVKEGLSIHFLGLTILTLMYGWRSAYAIAIIVSGLLCFSGEISAAEVPEYILLSCLIPILISYTVFLLSYQYCPRNIFAFIFIAGFFNGGLTGSLHLVISAFYLLFTTEYDWQTVYNNYLVFTPLLAFPEGLLNGMAATMLCVFKPELLRVFSDRDYIYNHYRK